MDSRGPVRSTHTSARQWRLDRDIVLHLGVLAWLQFLCCWFFGPVAESRAPQNALQICYNKCVGAIRNALLAGKAEKLVFFPILLCLFSGLKSEFKHFMELPPSQYYLTKSF